MPLARPKFSDMDYAYPRGTAAEVKKLIGGRVNAAWITNTCVIRVSRSLNYSGREHHVRRDAGMATVSGDDRLWYGYRVREFIPYFTGLYGAPDMVLDDGTSEHDIATGRIYGPPRLGQGVIAMEISGWADATGHVDLWSGNRCSSGDCLVQSYLRKASKLHFWNLP